MLIDSTLLQDIRVKEYFQKFVFQTDAYFDMNLAKKSFQQWKAWQNQKHFNNE